MRQEIFSAVDMTYITGNTSGSADPRCNYILIMLSKQFENNFTT